MRSLLNFGKKYKPKHFAFQTHGDEDDRHYGKIAIQALYGQSISVYLNLFKSIKIFANLVEVNFHKIRKFANL